MEDLFDFDDAATAPVGITPIFGGTDYIFMKKMEYIDKTAESNPKIQFQLERRVPNKPVEKSTISFFDWTYLPSGELRAAGTEAYVGQKKAEVNRMFNIFTTYTFDMSEQDQKAALRGLKTWKETVNKIISLLPANYAELETTWFLQYRKGTIYLEIPAQYAVVRMGNGKSFPMKAEYNSMTPASKTAVPTEFSVNTSEVGVPVEDLF